jgi:ABC-2 type transport system ATP-binding protein
MRPGPTRYREVLLTSWAVTVALATRVKHVAGIKVTSMFEIETKNLTKSFGNLVAVKNLNLQIRKGTIFGFLGPNGAGKSTTVKMLTGLLRPDEGEALISGLSILSSPLEVKKKIGVLPEDLALFDSLTIWEHLMMCGPIYGLDRSETEKRGEQLLKYLDLWPSRNVYVDQASSGMRKKCSLGMALLHNPGVLFLDEPFEGIDPVSSRNIKDLLTLLAGRGATIFLTSHILEVVERLVESFAIIVGGEIVCSQTVEETLQAGQTIEDLFLKHVRSDEVEQLEWIG